ALPIFGLGVARGTGLGDGVGTGVKGHVGARGLRTREVVRGVVGPPGVQGEVGGHVGSTVVVDDVLDHDQLGCLVVVGDRAVLRLAHGDGAGAVCAIGLGVA